METKKILDKNGLEYYTGKIKQQIPKKTSDLTNDSDYITSSDIPDISGKQDTLTFDSKPTLNSTNPVTSGGLYETFSNYLEHYKYDSLNHVYKATFNSSLVAFPIIDTSTNKLNMDNLPYATDITDDINTIPTTSAVYNALDSKADTSDIPTKVSELTNDSGYITSETDPVFNASAAKNITSTDITNWNNKQAALVSGTNIKTINNANILGSGNIDIEAGACVEQSSTAPTDADIVLWIEDSDIDGSGGGGGTSIEVIDSLISDSSTNALSANQGRILNGKITTIESDYLTSAKIKDNLTTDSATDVLSAKQGKILDTRISALEGNNLDSRLGILESQNLDSRLDTIEAKSLVESPNISKIVMVTEYPSTPDPNTLYIKVATL